MQGHGLFSPSRSIHLRSQAGLTQLGARTMSSLADVPENTDSVHV